MISNQLTTIVQSYPVQIGISITDRCNLFCKMCERNYYIEKGILDIKNDMAPAKAINPFKKVINIIQAKMCIK